MSTLKLKRSPTLSPDRGVTNHPSLLSPRRPWIYVSISSVVGVIFLVNFFVTPLAVYSDTVSIDPTVPQAQPGIATSNLLKDFNSQNVAVSTLGYVTHSYIAGRGTILVFTGDNIQIFEYPTSEAARIKALAILGRLPRVGTEDYFHLYRQGNLIGLYFGYNAEVLKVTEAVMGPPLLAP